jgi:hypothetical protein
MSGANVVRPSRDPLETPPFRWTPARINHPALEALRWLDAVEVRMEIETGDRARFWEAATAAGMQMELEQVQQ